MDISFDPAKDAKNIAAHGMSLAEAESLEWGTVLAKPDTRRDYGEQRWIGYGYIGTRLHCVVFTFRGNECRVISLRKANSREVQRYAAT